MSRFFPHPQYAEDQPYAYTILTTHVLHRGLQAGALFGGATGVIRSVIARRKNPPTHPLQVSFGVRVLRSAGVGALAGTGFITIGLLARMNGREDIEWRDRSWRLLTNEGQVETDDWSIAGSVLGGVATLTRESGFTKGAGLRILGGASLGNLAGVGGYMLWRYGVNSGNRT